MKALLDALARFDVFEARTQAQALGWEPYLDLSLASLPSKPSPKACRAWHAKAFTTLVLLNGWEELLPHLDADNGFEPLLMACEEGLDNVVGALLGKGVPVMSPYERARFCVHPLHLAAERGRVEIVQRLIHAGANINAVHHFGATALGLLVEHGPDNIVECAQVLLEAGASATHFSSPSLPPLHVVCNSPDTHTPALVELLITHGACFDKRIQKRTARQILESRPQSTQGAVDLTQKVLHAAARAQSNWHAKQLSTHTPHARSQSRPRL